MVIPKFLTLAGFGFFTIYTASSQTLTDSMQHLGEIVVAESRLQIPFADQNRTIIVLDRQTIAKLPARSVQELLAYVAGLDVRQRGPWGTQSDIGIDGGTFDQTLVLVNGVKISDPQTGHNMMNLPLTMASIDRIEVIRGAAARIYGVNTLNGAINIVTREPLSDELEVHAFAGSSLHRDTASNQLYAGYGIEATGSLSGAKSGHLLSISRIQGNGYRYNTDFLNHKIFYQGEYRLDASSRIQGFAGWTRNGFGANGFYAAPADVDAWEELETVLAAVSAEVTISPHWKLKPVLSYRYNDDDYIFVKARPELYRNRHFTNVLNAVLNNAVTTRAGLFGIGLEYRQETINSTNLGENQRSYLGFYGEYGFNLVDRLLINVGAYLNYNKQFGWELLPGIDAGYELAEGLRVFGSAGTGQRLPTYTDWYYTGPQNIGNDQLRPESSLYYEGGLKYHRYRILAGASVFQRKTSDFIDWVKDSLTGPWKPVNFRDLQTTGLTVSGRYLLLARADQGMNLSVGAEYTWLRPRFRQVEDQEYSKYALENLRHQLILRASAAFREKYTLNLTARYLERVNYKSYWLLDARANATFGAFNLYADLNNIANVQYVEAGAVPLPGRWISLGLKWQLGAK